MLVEAFFLNGSRLRAQGAQGRVYGPIPVPSKLLYCRLPGLLSTTLSLSLDSVVHILAFSASPLTIRSPECQVLGVSTEREKQNVRLFETYLCIPATRLAHASGHPQSMAMLESPCAAPMEQLLLLIHTEFQCAL